MLGRGSIEPPPLTSPFAKRYNSVLGLTALDFAKGHTETENSGVGRCPCQLPLSAASEKLLMILSNFEMFIK